MSEYGLKRSEKDNEKQKHKPRIFKSVRALRTYVDLSETIEFIRKRAILKGQV